MVRDEVTALRKAEVEVSPKGLGEDKGDPRAIGMWISDVIRSCKVLQRPTVQEVSHRVAENEKVQQGVEKVQKGLEVAKDCNLVRFKIIQTHAATT
jgi:hypothetical protein